MTDLKFDDKGLITVVVQDWITNEVLMVAWANQEAVADAVSMPVIASGGCCSKEHIFDVFSQTGASAALAASIFHYNECTVGEVKEYLRDRGVNVR